MDPGEGMTMDLNAKLKAGCRVGPYEIRRLLGVGYAGEVHEAVQVFTGNPVALKYLHSEHLESEHKVSRFSVEATTLFKLEHANVVRVVDAGWDDGSHPWMAMELLEGETLGALLGRQGALSPQLALQYALDIAWGIDAAHEIGVIHRDLKPDNVFITSRGAIKVLDFSAAKFLTSDLRTTRPPEMTCTLAYAPPELLEGTQADARIDVYSLGLMLWQMLAGRHPFQDVLGKQHALITAHFLTTPESLTTAARLPALFDVLLRHAVAKPLTSRYGTMAGFAQAIMKAQRLLQVEIDAGRIVIDVAPGEPSLPEDPRTRSLYQPPEVTPRHDTEPVQPGARVALSSHALPRAEGTLASARPIDPPAPRPLGPLGTIPLPVESVAVAVAVARKAMGRPPMPSTSERASPAPARAELPSSRTPEPMEADVGIIASARHQEERSRPTLSRATPAPARGISARVLVPTLLALILLSGNVTWWLTRGQGPSVRPASITDPIAPQPTALVPDLPVTVEPIAPTAPTAPATAEPAPSATTVIAPPPASPVAPSAAPSAAAHKRTSTAPSAPARPSAATFKPLFDLPQH
jgi:eukaryotic-like serine/threonine-protein kinase